MDDLPSMRSAGPILTNDNFDHLTLSSSTDVYTFTNPLTEPVVGHHLTELVVGHHLTEPVVGHHCVKSCTSLVIAGRQVVCKRIDEESKGVRTNRSAS